jgi:GNAT superfamily N-acetyltransferase
MVMVSIVEFVPDKHRAVWEDFIFSSYENPNYVALSPDFLRWQFFDNPANTTGGYTLWVVFHEAAVVGQLGFVPFLGRTPGGEFFEGAYPINLMVRPEFRAVGLGVMLLRKLMEKTPVVVNPGANSAGAALAQGLGLHDFGCLRRYIYVAKPEAARLVALDGGLPTGPISSHPPSDSTNIVVTRNLPSNIEEAFQPPIPCYAAERNRAFLRWRYETHPAFTYEFIIGPNLRSVLVFHEEREVTTGVLVFRIVDFLAEEECQDALLNTVLQAAHSRGAAIVDFYCSLRCYEAALKRAGFFDESDHKDARIAGLFQPLDFRDASIRVLASKPPNLDGTTIRWYITKADSDQDRPNDRRLIRPYAPF